MEFVVNEKMCHNLSNEMLQQMRQIAQWVAEIDSQNGTLRSALGEDYNAIASSVRVMTSELNSAMGELNTIIRDMKEYMSQVHQARVSLN